MLNTKEIKRKVWHALWGIALAFAVLKTYPFVIQILLIGLLLLLMTLKTAHKHGYHLWLVDDIMEELIRKDRSIDGAIYFILGSLIVSLLFSQKIAAVSILILGISDSLATIVGVHSSHRIYKKKTIEGSLAFFISSFLIVSVSFNFMSALIVGLASTLIELFGEIDDNLLVPPTSALLLAFTKGLI